MRLCQQCDDATNFVAVRPGRCCSATRAEKQAVGSAVRLLDTPFAAAAAAAAATASCTVQAWG
jgi:hypothetical protein